MVHRDLKPENILLSATDHVLVTDFGTALDKEKEAAQFDADRAERHRLRDEEGGERDRIASAGSSARRGSFVGTAEYVSPEVLANRRVSYAADLWALGCIVFQMLAGHPPFRGSSQYQVFQAVQRGEIDFPDGFPADAADLVRQLCVAVPKERLGAGKGGFARLQKHAFFRGIEGWKALHEQDVPVFAPHPPTRARQDAARAARAAEQERAREPRDETPADAAPVRLYDWTVFLRGAETIVLQSTVVKRKGMSKKRRQLILTSAPRLIYVDATAMEEKGQVALSPALEVRRHNARQFDIVTPSRTYIFEDQLSKAAAWEKAILAAVADMPEGAE